jgi:hypothetical protein
MVQFGNTIQRLRELDYRVMDYNRLVEILESRDSDEMWEDTFASMLDEEISILKRNDPSDGGGELPSEVAELLGNSSPAQAARSSNRKLVSFVNSEACRKIIKKYHKILLEEKGAGNPVSRAGPNESRLYKAICELHALHLSRDANSSIETAAQKGSGMVSSITIIVFFSLFCCVVAFEPIFVTVAAEQSRFSEASVTVVEALVSIGLGLVMAACEGNIWQALNLYHLILFFPTGFLRAVGGILELLVLRWIDPMTFLVISQLRLVLTAFASWAVLRKMPNSIQIRDCVMISLTCLLYSVLDEADDDEDEVATHSFGIGLAIFAVICKVVASVWHDHALKKAGKLSVAVQSFCICAGMILPAVAGMLGMEAAGLAEESLPESASVRVIVVALGCYILMKNWIGNVVVSHGSSVLKYVAYAMALPVAYVAEYMLGWRLVDLPTVIVVWLICVGVWMFTQDAPHAPTSRGDSEPTPATKLLRRMTTKNVRTQPMSSPEPIIPSSDSATNEP